MRSIQLIPVFVFQGERRFPLSYRPVIVSAHFFAADHYSYKVYGPGKRRFLF